jgi:hypothetical protein
MGDKMTIFVLIEINYDDWKLRGAYNSKGAAQREQNRLSHLGIHCQIEETNYTPV